MWNAGNSIAKNVVESWNNSEGIILFDKEKMPFEVLEPQKSFELVINTYGIAPGKLQIKTEWETESGEKKEKIQWCNMYFVQKDKYRFYELIEKYRRQAERTPALVRETEMR